MYSSDSALNKEFQILMLNYFTKLCLTSKLHKFLNQTGFQLIIVGCISHIRLCEIQTMSVAYVPLSAWDVSSYIKLDVLIESAENLITPDALVGACEIKYLNEHKFLGRPI